MDKLYGTGVFAKMAKVTERTIRYYDSVGLLKPTVVLDNGYRKYSDSDFLKIQKIISLRNLGFSIEEIFPLIMKDDEKNIMQSLQMQVGLIEKKISHLSSLNDSLKKVLKALDEDTLNWDRIIELVQLTNMDGNIIEQFKSVSNLNIRISLHEKYSTNSEGWFSWLKKQVEFTCVNRLLEIGCGNGEFWNDNKLNLRNREFFLSDTSQQMLDDTRGTLGKDFNYLLLDCESIPFKSHYFDVVMANHVLFYVQDLNSGLNEISRVLCEKGTFYCTSYGQDHMKEIHELVTKFDDRIILSENNLNNRFGLENGKSILLNYFSEVERLDYSDELKIDEVQPLIDYIFSCFGNQHEIIAHRIEEFREFVNQEMAVQGTMRITKNAGLFICRK